MAKKTKQKAEKKVAEPAIQRKKSAAAAEKTGKYPTKTAKKKPQSAKKSAKIEKKPPETENKPVRKRKSAAPRKNPKITRPTKAEQLRIIARRKRILELKKNGVSVRKISALLQSEGVENSSPATVHADLIAILSEETEELGLEARHYRALMIEQTEDQFFRVKSSMIETVEVTDPASGEKILVRKEVCDVDKEKLLLQNRAFLDRMVAASKAEQSKNNAAELLARLIGADPKELPGDVPEFDN